MKHFKTIILGDYINILNEKNLIRLHVALRNCAGNKSAS